MNLENFNTLCQVCDGLLTDQEAGQARLAIPWLHIVREHPHFLEQYEYLFEGNGRSVWRSDLLRLARNLLGWLRQFSRIRRFDDNVTACLSEVPRSVDLLIVSHLINPGHIATERDFYFDMLPGFLKKHGYSVVVAVINHTGGRLDEEMHPSCLGDGVFRLVLGPAMCLSGALSSFLAALSEMLTLLRLAGKVREPFARRVIARAAIEALSGGTRDAQRIGLQVAELVRKLNCRAVLTTYEGHAWERTVFHRVHTVSPRVLRLAYQHAAIFRLQHGLRRTLGPGHDPDIVLASGELPRAELARIGGERSPQVRLFGSSRSIAYGPVQARGVQDSDEKECLVLPEGLNSESAMMIRFASLCAIELPGIRFVIRLHPAIQFSSLRRSFAELATLPHNVVFSSRALNDDAMRASWVLYRGTTAVVAAAQYGALPVYLRGEGEEMSIDPLYLLGDERAIVGTVGEFSACIRGHDLSEVAVSMRRGKILDHFRGLFSPLDFRAVADCL